MWNQAFKWVSQYVPSEQPEKKFEPKKMTQEDFDFLEKAFESISVNETKETIKRLDKLKEKQEIKGDKSDEEERIVLIEEILSFIDGLEISRNIVRCKRFREIVDYFFDTCHFNLKLNLARLLSNMMQNDKIVQEEALNSGLLKCLIYLKSNEFYDINDENNKQLVNKTILVLSGFINGECTEAKKAFVNENGYQLLFNIYKENTIFRILKIVEELTKPEIDKILLETSDYLIDNFLKINGVDNILEVLSQEYTKNNEDEAIVCLNILSNTSHKWDSSTYDKFSLTVNELFKGSSTNLKKMLLENVKKVNNNYNSKSQDLSYLDETFGFEQTEDGNKIISLDQPIKKENDVKILSIGN